MLIVCLDLVTSTQPAIDGYTMLLSQEYNKMPRSGASQKEIERSLPVF